MGLFDKLLKEGSELIEKATSEESKEKAANLFKSLKSAAQDVVNEVASEENKEKASEFFKGIKENFGETINAIKEEAAKKEEEEQYKEEKYYTEDESDKRTAREKILQVLADEFPKYEVVEDVSPKSIGGTGRFMNYSIVVYDGYEPKLFIMLIGKTTCYHREYRWAREAAESQGYQFINFINHYPNTIEYITDRLHKYL